jgi:hypothetical protein
LKNRSTTNHRSGNQLAKPGCVLIDDDALIQMAWEISAQAHGVELVTFSDAASFLKVADAYARDTAIYVDSRLKGSESGERVAYLLHEMGFDNLRLATALPRDFFGHLPWIREIVGKEPPWLNGEGTAGEPKS